MIKNTDVIVYQTQAIQNNPDYQDEVNKVLKKIRELSPDKKIWVQVSVNPPSNREEVDSKVIEAINLIKDKVDLVVVFYANDNERVEVMQSVIKNYRQAK